MSQARPIAIQRHEAWVEITMNRPERLNALSPDPHEALMGALTQAEDDRSCRAVLLTGEGRGFCSGQELTERDPRNWQSPPDLSASVTRLYR